jgi:hypothetical protein
VRDGDDYIINGAKRFITNAPEAGVFTVMARTDGGRKGAGGVSAFIVERDTPGLSLGKIDKKMGQRGAHTCDVIFENCRVPASAIIGGKEGMGFKTAMKVLDKGRLHIAAVCVGAAERMLDDALRYAMEREQFGQPIAEFQLIQAMLADSKAEIYAARSMVLDAARRRDNGERHLHRSLVLQAVRLRDVRPRGRPLGADPRRRRLRLRLRGRTLLPRRAPVPHLRRDLADPATGHRPQHDQSGATLMNDIDTDQLAGGAAGPHRCHCAPLGRARPHAPALHDGQRHWTTPNWPEPSTTPPPCCAQLKLRAGDRLMVVGENCVAQVVLTLFAAAASMPGWSTSTRACPRARSTRSCSHCGARRVIYTVRHPRPEPAAHGQRNEAGGGVAVTACG